MTFKEKRKWKVLLPFETCRKEKRGTSANTSLWSSAGCQICSTNMPSTDSNPSRAAVAAVQSFAANVVYICWVEWEEKPLPLCGGVLNGCAELQKGPERVQAPAPASRCDCHADSDEGDNLLSYEGDLSTGRDLPCLSPCCVFLGKKGSSASCTLWNIISLADNNHTLSS